MHSDCGGIETQEIKVSEIIQRFNGNNKGVSHKKQTNALARIKRPTMHHEIFQSTFRLLKTRKISETYSGKIKIPTKASNIPSALPQKINQTKAKEKQVFNEPAQEIPERPSFIRKLFCFCI